jgi:hypothetical protein
MYIYSLFRGAFPLTYHSLSPFGFLSCAPGQGWAKSLFLFDPLQSRLYIVHQYNSVLSASFLLGSTSTVVR